MTTPTQVIDVNTEEGKNFIKNIEKLKKELKLNGTGEKIRQHRSLTQEQIEANPFLLDFMNGHEIFKDFEIKKMSIGNFGRKAGYSYSPIDKNLFRFFIHLGDSEIYYLDDDKVKDKMLPLLNGQGFIISSFSAPETSITVYQDPIRVIYDLKIQSQVPKIRPRNYSRTTLVYDLHYNISIDQEESATLDDVQEESATLDDVQEE